MISYATFCGLVAGFMLIHRVSINCGAAVVKLRGFK